MFQFTKTLHVLAVGLWFGTAVFFSFPVALSLFVTFQRVADEDPRPAWFPRASLYDTDPRGWSPPPAGIANPFDTIRDVHNEQASRAAGAAVGPMFDWYFLVQGACAVVALSAALRWSRAEPDVRVHQLRVALLILAFSTVLVGWPIERKVSELRGPRNATTDVLLQAAPSIPDDVYRAAVEARRAFGMWHGFSTTLNLGTTAIVTLVMALAARLPNSPLVATRQQSAH
jgi:acyl phosphate:glycerol-3-phosphate acyltransferase